MGSVSQLSRARQRPLDWRASHSCAAEREKSSFRKRLGFTLIVGALAGTCSTDPALAHGLAGKRFFPATIATDDPFVADELSLPTVSWSRTSATADEASTRETSISGEISKRITPNFAVAVGGEYQRLSPSGEPSSSGFNNLELGFKYQFYKNDAAETILSAGLGWEVGGTGSKAVGSESFSTLTPTFFFGKGFGDLPESVPYLKPFALTGTVGVAIPTRASTTTMTVDPDTGDIGTNVQQNPNVLQLGFALEYSLPYLQAFVKDVGLPAPFNRMIPLVELSIQKPLDRGGGPTLATLYPGVIWAGRYVQGAAEAIVPLNSSSGRGVGALVQLHFYLDDIFPRSIGRPLFGI